MSDEGRTAPTAERLAKVIARAGRCSRRDAEDWIRAGRVSVNGSVIRTPAFNVTAKDLVRIDGQPLPARSGTRLWLYHKPPGLVVTEKDPEGRPTIFDKLAEAGLPRVLTVGRLDLNTEGLLLLTNDGGLKRVLELPATGWLRRYRVRAFGSVTQVQLDGLQKGVEVEGVKYGPIEAQLERQQGSNVWLVVSLREGKNREVKNVLANLGLQVNRLIRVSYGPFQLGDLPVGAVDVVKSRMLRDQLGTKLAAAAGADFESDVPEAAAPAREVRRAPAGPRRSPGRPDERSRDAPAKPAGRPRRVFFDDGRPPVEYVPKPEPVGRNRPAAEAGRPATRTGRAERSPRPESDRPRGPRRDGDRKGPPRAAGDRPRTPRSPDDRPRTSRPEGERPRGPRPPLRPEGARPRPSRPGKPERSERSAAPRGGPRTERPARAPRGDGPARGQRADRPARAPQSDRTSGKPRSGAPGRPRPPGRPARPSGGPSRPRPGGAGKPPRKPRP